MKKIFFAIWVTLMALVVTACSTPPVDNGITTTTTTGTDNTTPINGSIDSTYTTAPVTSTSGTISTTTTTPATTASPSSKEVVFNITGNNYSFSQTELVVNKGDRVKIVFTSLDGLHDWALDEFNAATDKVQSGGTSETTFIASRAGTFEYYCSVGNHRQLGMVGKLIVRDKTSK
jgi:plastocyanin